MITKLYFFWISNTHIDKIDIIDDEANNNLPAETDPNPFHNILHNQFRPFVVINNLHDTLAIKEDFDNVIFNECVPMYDGIDS